jgi:hypothetical protein
MQIPQQIVGVNDRLGNYAVAKMQGTTRCIYDGIQGGGTNFSFFENVQSRIFPFTNISQNRFEVGESLAIESIVIAYMSDVTTFQTAQLNGILELGQNTAPLINIYIGNQRVVKDLDMTYSLVNLGNIISTNSGNTLGDLSAVFRLETPIVIPPQIEFYVTLELNVPAVETSAVFCFLQGTGTLLNPKSNF